jgi:hypothetical protein
MPVTVTRDSHYCTCFGHLGWRNTNRNDPISVALPKVVKASRKAKTLLILWCFFADIFQYKLCQCTQALNYQFTNYFIRDPPSHISRWGPLNIVQHFYSLLTPQWDATRLSMTTLSIVTLSLMALSIMTHYKDSA